MSSRKRSTRRLGNRNLRRSIHPMMEDLEQRLVLSSQPVAAALKDFPDYIIREVAVPGQAGKYMPMQAPTPTLSGGYTPQQIQGAYGINQISFGAIKGDGSGQTIALIDAGDNTGFQPTGPNYAGSADSRYSTRPLASPTHRASRNSTRMGEPPFLPQSPALGPEIALDIEWAHTIAPGANIVLVEASSATSFDLLQAAETAVTKLGASVVSMSFGSSLEYFGDGGSRTGIGQLVPRARRSRPTRTSLFWHRPATTAILPRVSPPVIPGPVIPRSRPW